MDTYYVAAIIVGGKGGSAFWFYVNGQGFVSTPVSQATLYDTITLNNNINNIALEAGGRCFVLPVSVGG